MRQANNNQPQLPLSGYVADDSSRSPSAPHFSRDFLGDLAWWATRTSELDCRAGRWITSSHIVDAVLVGTGDYEGLQDRVHWEGVPYPLVVAGTIEPTP